VPRRTLGLIVLATAVATGCTGEDAPRGDGTPAPTAACGLRWSRGAELPTPRTEVAGAELDGRIHIAGGFTSDGAASAVMEIYDPGSDAWSDGIELPEPLHHAGLAAARGRLWLVGGYRSDGRASAKVWSWASSEPAWKPEPPLRVARGAHAVAVAHDQIFAVGGAGGSSGGGLIRAFESLPVGATAWQPLPDLPDPRDHLAAAGLSPPGEGVSGSVLVFGGRKLSLTTNSTRVDRFALGPADDAAEGRWVSEPDLEHARGGIAAAVVGANRFVFGGEEPRGTIAPVEALAGARWTAAGTLPTPRHGLAAVALQNRIHVIGGGPTPGLSVSGANEILTVDGRFGEEDCP
jgi:hypothetical protein